jgi:hypothetical protein
MSRLTRGQLRRLIKEEYHQLSKQNNLNESVAALALGGAALVGLTALVGYLNAKFHVPKDRMTGEPLFVQEYDAIGNAIMDGQRPEEAVTAELNRNSKLASSFKSSSYSSNEDDYDERLVYSDKYGAQDPTLLLSLI